MLVASLAIALLNPLAFAVAAELGVAPDALTTPILISSLVTLGLLPGLVGTLTSRLPRRHLLRLGLAAVGAGCFLTTAASTPAVLVIAHAAVNLGFVAAMIAALSLSADLSRPIEHGRAAAFIVAAQAFAVTNGTALLLGGTASNLPDLPVDWRGLHLLVALVAVLAFGLTFALVAPASSIEDRTPSTPKSAPVGWLSLVIAGYVFASLANSVASVLASPADLSLSVSNMVVRMLVSWVGVLGAIVGGFVADGGQRLRHPGGVLVGGVGAAAIIVALAPLLGSSAGAWLALQVTALALSAAVIEMVVLSAILVHVPRRRRGLWLGVGLGCSIGTNVLAPGILFALANPSPVAGASYGLQIVVYLTGLGALGALGWAMIIAGANR